MTTTLGTHLIFDMRGSCAGLDQVLDGALDIERTRAKAGVDVYQQRQITDIGNTTHVGQHVIQGVDAQIRQTEGAGCHTATGQVDGLETRALGQ